MKLDERKLQLLACDWIRHSAQYAAEPLLRPTRAAQKAAQAGEFKR